MESEPPSPIARQWFGSEPLPPFHRPDPPKWGGGILPHGRNTPSGYLPAKPHSPEHSSSHARGHQGTINFMGIFFRCPFAFILARQTFRILRQRSVLRCNQRDSLLLTVYILEHYSASSRMIPYILAHFFFRRGSSTYFSLPPGPWLF